MIGEDAGEEEAKRRLLVGCGVVQLLTCGAHLALLSGGGSISNWLSDDEMIFEGK